MVEQEIWEGIKSCIKDEFDDLKSHDDPENIIVALNIHNNGNKVPIAKHERPSDEVYKKFLKYNIGDSKPRASKVNFLTLIGDEEVARKFRIDDT